MTNEPDTTLRALLRAETARADAAEADARHWRTTALWYGAPDKAARP